MFDSFRFRNAAVPMSDDLYFASLLLITTIAKVFDEKNCLLDDLSGQAFAQSARQHWSIENNCHGQLDVLFGEDASHVRERTLANNLSWLQRVAIRFLKQHPVEDRLKGKREMVGWSEDFLAEVLQKFRGKTSRPFWGWSFPKYGFGQKFARPENTN